MGSQPSSHFGSYHLVHALGAGGMGEVFLARHEGEGGIHRLVALKRILPHLSRDEKRAQLFLDEVRIAAQLAHGNVVQVTDHGRIAGRYFMAMEYVHGENLNEVFERLRSRKQTLPLEMLLHIAAATCEGLDYAHRKAGINGESLSIVHRDISPHNILLSFQGGVKIADFGVARAAHKTQKTLTGELRGKICYMSPEQAYGRALDQRSDLFSLGIVVYEGIAGRNPFLRDQPLASLEAVRIARVAPLSQICPDLPPEVEGLVHQLLRRNPTDRPDSARTLHDALQQAIRLHNLAVTPFDLADYLKDLFPEARAFEHPEEDQQSEQATAVGRRADGLDVAATREAKTVAYLKQRHPSGTLLQSAGSTDGTLAPFPRTRQSRWIVGLALAAALAAASAAVAIFVGGTGAGVAPVAPDAQQQTAAANARLQRRSMGVIADRDGGTGDTAVAADTRAPTTATQTRGVLQVTSQPVGARVSVAGHAHGKTPSRLTGLPTGQHRVTFRLPGYKPGSRLATIRAGRTTRLHVALRPLPATVVVESNRRCTVELDGRRVGETPRKRLAVGAGRHHVRCIDLARGIRASRRVNVRAGQTARVLFRFGVLAINVKPWASVSVDGKSRGTTPLRIVLTAGEHRVSLENRAAGLSRTLSLYISAERTSRISHW